MRAIKDLEEWYAAQLKVEPWLAKATDVLFAGKAQPRKLALLCDECMDQAFIDWLRTTTEYFKVFTLPKRRSDEQLWQEALHRCRLLVTADNDFLDDRRYPLHISPGVLHIDAPSTESRIIAFTR